MPHKRQAGYEDRVVSVPEDNSNFYDEEGSDEDESSWITDEEALAFEKNLGVIRSRCERFYSFMKKWKLMEYNDCAKDTVESMMQIVLAIEHNTRHTDYKDEEFQTKWTGGKPTRCLCDFKGVEMRDAARRHRYMLIRWHGQTGDNTVAWPTKKSAHGRKIDEMAPMSERRHKYLMDKKKKKEDDDKKRNEKREERQRNSSSGERKRPRE